MINASSALGSKAAYDAPTNTAPQTESDMLLSRLNSIRGSMAEACISARHGADKIVGVAPTPIQAGNAGSGQIKGERGPAGCFLEAIAHALNDLESILGETHEHLNRLHRPF